LAWPLIVAAVYPAAQFFAEAEALEEDFEDDVEELLGELADFEPHPASENTSATANDTNVNTFLHEKPPFTTTRGATNPTRRITTNCQRDRFGLVLITLTSHLPERFCDLATLLTSGDSLAWARGRAVTSFGCFVPMFGVSTGTGGWARRSEQPVVILVLRARPAISNVMSVCSGAAPRRD
jgi:hypothetical protein